ncbi:MAG TPA: hypothetical protein VJ938_03350 [Acidimicrobiia bacterium]|nr:hypothetical protein [Acidimicrobiia bacterium]
MTALVIIEGVVIALLVVLVAGLLRSHADILRRLHALDGGDEPAGARATTGLMLGRTRSGNLPTHISGTSPGGSATSVSLTGSRGLVLAAFLSTGCSSCRTFWQDLGGGVDMPAPDVRPVIVTRSADEESASKIAELAGGATPIIQSTEAWDDFKVPGSPYFALVDASSGALIGEGAAGTWNQVRDLFSQAMADAGLDRTLGGSTVERHLRVDDHLRAAGIEPGHPSLFQNPHEPTNQEPPP